MIREEAFNLASSVADAGYSCQVDIFVMPKHVPNEHCSVHLNQTSFEHANLTELIEIGKPFKMHLHLIGGNLQYVSHAAD